MLWKGIIWKCQKTLLCYYHLLTQLRDNYDSLTELCQTYSVDINQINKTLLAIDYVYDKSVNQFV